MLCLKMVEYVLFLILELGNVDNFFHVHVFAVMAQKGGCVSKHIL